MRLILVLIVGILALFVVTVALAALLIDSEKRQ
jgi:hypothetical protein